MFPNEVAHCCKYVSSLQIQVSLNQLGKMIPSVPKRKCARSDKT